MLKLNLTSLALVNLNNSGMHKKTLIKRRRAARNRAKIHGTRKTPRLAVFRSNKHLSAQLIDDTVGKTIVHLSTRKAESAGKKPTKTQQAALLGAELAKKALAGGIERAVFDRRSYRYHGRVKALAEAAKANGLKI